MNQEDLAELQRILDRVFVRRQHPIYMPMALLAVLDTLGGREPLLPFVLPSTPGEVAGSPFAPPH